jgi:hypothetical protein
MDPKTNEMLEWVCGHIELCYSGGIPNTTRYIERVPGGWVYWTVFTGFTETGSNYDKFAVSTFVPEPPKL